MTTTRDNIEKLFPDDVMSKRERVEATLNCQAVDRAALLEQLSHNPRVVESKLLTYLPPAERDSFGEEAA